MKSKILFFCLWASLHVFAQDERLQSLLDSINPQGFTGFALYDINHSESLYSYQADRFFIPASNAKIYTLSSYNSFYGNDSILTAKYQVKNDTLFVIPTGDPTFLDHRFSSENLKELLNNTEYKVLALYLYDLVEPYSPGWSWDDFDQSYMPERNIFPLYGNIISQENIQFFEVNKTITTTRNFHDNSFSINADSTPFIVSNSLIIKILEELIDKEVIVFDKEFEVDDFKALYSNPTSMVLKEMMLESDNFIAEQLWINMAMSTGVYIEKIKKNFNAYLNIEPKLVDGSGLSRYDLISPNQMITLLGYFTSLEPYYFLDYFPENGVSGTLEHSYLKEKSYVFAKTGSMSGVYNLSGFLKTDSGNILMFSLLNNNFTESGKNLKPRIESLLLYIKHNY